MYFHSERKQKLVNIFQENLSSNILEKRRILRACCLVLSKREKEERKKERERERGRKRENYEESVNQSAPAARLNGWLCPWRDIFLLLLFTDLLNESTSVGEKKGLHRKEKHFRLYFVFRHLTKVACTMIFVNKQAKRSQDSISRYIHFPFLRTTKDVSRMAKTNFFI